MLKKRFSLLVILILLLLLVISACGDEKPATPTLVGKWEQVTAKSVTGFGATPGTIIQFFADGNMDLGKYAGSYTVLDGATLKIAMGNNSAIASMYTYKLEGDKLTILQNGATEPAQYKRK